MTFELVVRRVGAGHCADEAINTVYTDVYTAVAGRAELVAAYRSRGFVGGRNSAAHYRLSKRVDGRRVRLDIFLRSSGWFSRN